MTDKITKPKHIRQDLEKDYHHLYGNSSSIPRKEKKYQGLRLNWKDAVILSMVLFFTGLYQTRVEAQELFDLTEIDSGMMLNYHPQTNNYSTIQLLSSDYEIDIRGIVANVKVKQKFHNSSTEWIDEGMYAFPIEHTGAVYHMRLKLGERIIEGEIHEKKKAQQIYDTAKSEGLAASIVKQYRPNLFTTEVANIMPNEIIEVEINYQQVLRYENGKLEYRLPLKIKPRYISQNTDSEHMSPLPTADISDQNQRSIKVQLESGFELEQLKSLYHNVDIDDFGVVKNINFTDQQLVDTNDFVLQWQPQRGQYPQAALFSEVYMGEEYALLMMVPPQSTEKLEQRREMVFIIDTSGSMHGRALNQAKDALLLAMTQLDPRDSFNIIEFNSYARELFSKPEIASPDNINQAIDFIDSLISTGGTNMTPALELAMNDSIADGYLKQIVFMTDGSVGQEAELFKYIDNNIGEARLFTVAIGPAPNNYFMSKASIIGRGTYTHIGDLNEVDESINALFEKLSRPALTDIHVEWNQKVKQSPKVISDLYLDQPLFVTAKMSELDTNISMSGFRNKNSWSQSFEFRSDKQSHGIAKLWARQHIDELTEDYMLGADIDAEDLKQQITQLALKYNLVSEFTSLVAVDKNPNLSRLIALQAKEMKEQTMASTNFPQTSTGWRLQLLLGLFLLGLSYLLRRIHS